MATHARTTSLPESAMLVLAAFRTRALCATAIANRVERATGGAVRLGPATVDTILTELLRRRFLRAAGAAGRLTCYAITGRGRDALQAAGRAAAPDDAPDECGDAPDECGDAPDECSDAPDECSDAPDECGDAPDERDDAPDECGDAPDERNADRPARRRLCYRLRPCAPTDMDGLAAWFSAMAEKGLFFQRDWGLAAGFVRGVPRAVRYRLTPMRNRPHETWSFTPDPDAEQLSLFRSCGWRPAGSYGWFHLYRTDDPAARELHTDPAVLAPALPSVMRRVAINHLLLPLLLLGFLLLRLLDGDRGCLLAAVEIGPVPLLLVFASLFFAVLRGLLDLCSLRLRQSRLRRGAPDAGKRRGRLAALLGRGAVLYGLTLACVVLRMCLPGRETPLARYADALPFATLRTLMGEDAVCLPPEPYDAGPVGELREWGNLLAPRCIEYAEQADVILPDGAAGNGALYLRYYRLADPWLAERLFGELYRFDRKRYEGFAALEAPPVTGIDEVAAYVRIAGAPALLLRQGSVVLQAELVFSGGGETPPLERWAPLLAQSLTE